MLLLASGQVNIDKAEGRSTLAMIDSTTVDIARMPEMPHDLRSARLCTSLCMR